MNSKFNNRNNQNQQQNQNQDQHQNQPQNLFLFFQSSKTCGFKIGVNKTV